MSTDGVNPFGNQSSMHSTWLVVLLVLNLPLWLCKKHKYLMLSILVSGPKQPGDHIDVYLKPLVDDLQTLWKPGVKDDWDEFERKDFTLHAMFSPPSTTTRLIATSPSRVKGKVKLAPTA